MSNVVTSITLATELSDHRLAVWVAVTALAGRDQAVLGMTEGAGLVGVPSLAPY